MLLKFKKKEKKGKKIDSFIFPRVLPVAGVGLFGENLKTLFFALTP